MESMDRRNSYIWNKERIRTGEATYEWTENKLIVCDYFLSQFDSKNLLVNDIVTENFFLNYLKYLKYFLQIKTKWRKLTFFIYVGM